MSETRNKVPEQFRARVFLVDRLKANTHNNIRYDSGCVFKESTEMRKDLKVSGNAIIETLTAQCFKNTKNTIDNDQNNSNYIDSTTNFRGINNKINSGSIVDNNNGTWTVNNCGPSSSVINNNYIGNNWTSINNGNWRNNNNNLWTDSNSGTWTHENSGSIIFQNNPSKVGNIEFREGTVNFLGSTVNFDGPISTNGIVGTEGEFSGNVKTSSLHTSILSAENYNLQIANIGSIDYCPLSSDSIISGNIGIPGSSGKVRNLRRIVPDSPEGGIVVQTNKNNIVVSGHNLRWNVKLGLSQPLVIPHNVWVMVPFNLSEGSALTGPSGQPLCEAIVQSKIRGIKRLTVASPFDFLNNSSLLVEGEVNWQNNSINPGGSRSIAITQHSSENNSEVLTATLNSVIGIHLESLAGLIRNPYQTRSQTIPATTISNFNGVLAMWVYQNSGSPLIIGGNIELKVRWFSS